MGHHRPKSKKKQQTTLPVKTGRRTVAKGANEGNVVEVRRILDHVHSLKNTISVYCQANIRTIFEQAHEFTKHYKLFSSTRLNAWEIQKLFLDIVNNYVTTWDSRLVNNPFRQGLGFEVTKKAVVIHYAQSPLSQLLNYLLRIPHAAEFVPTKGTNKTITEYFSRPFVQKYRSRIIALVEAKQERLLKSIQVANYTTGTYRLHPKESHAVILHDDTNTQHKEFIQLRKHTNYSVEDCIRLPLKVIKTKNKKTLRTDKEFYLTMKEGKIHLLYTYEAEEPEFKEAVYAMAFDANTKNNLLASSSGEFVSYDVLSIQKLVEQVATLGVLNKLTHGKQKQLEHICRENEARLKAIIAQVLDYCVANQIFDVIIENLDIQGDATFIKHPGLKIKYSKLVRLLRLSNIKKWFVAMGEKRGIRVHLTNPAYSSQECAECHHIRKDNRLSQEVFKCRKCGHTQNADVNAAQVLLSRFFEDVLFKAFHHFDKYGRACPKKLDHRSYPAQSNSYWAGKVFLKAIPSHQGQHSFVSLERQKAEASTIAELNEA